jgi:hypothetical protein
LAPAVEGRVERRCRRWWRVELPSGVPRYRCGACGNLTRFEVVRTSTTRSFHHFTVGGELTIDEIDVVEDEVVSVTCRWCGTGSAIEVIEDDEATSVTP